MASQKAKSKKKNQQPLWNVPEEPTVYKTPQITFVTKILFAINAVLCFAAVLIPFIPLLIDKKLITQPTIPNMIGIIGRDLGEDANRTDGAVFLILFFVGVVFIAVGLVESYYRERIAGLFTFIGSGVLVYFSGSWLMYSAPDDTAPKAVSGQVTDVLKQPLSDVLRETAIPYLVLIFAILAMLASAVLIILYETKKQKKEG